MSKGKSRKRREKAERRFIRKLIGTPEPAPPEFDHIQACPDVMSLEEFNLRYGAPGYEPIAKHIDAEMFAKLASQAEYLDSVPIPTEKRLMALTTVDGTVILGLDR